MFPICFFHFNCSCIFIWTDLSMILDAPHQRGQLHYGCFKHLHSRFVTNVPQPSPPELQTCNKASPKAVSTCTLNYMNDALTTKPSVMWPGKKPTGQYPNIEKQAQLDKWNWMKLNESFNRPQVHHRRLQLGQVKSFCSRAPMWSGTSLHSSCPLCVLEQFLQSTLRRVWLYCIWGMFQFCCEASSPIPLRIHGIQSKWCRVKIPFPVPLYNRSSTAPCLWFLVFWCPWFLLIFCVLNIYSS